MGKRKGKSSQLLLSYCEKCTVVRSFLLLVVLGPDDLEREVPGDGALASAVGAGGNAVGAGEVVAASKRSWEVIMGYNEDSTLQIVVQCEQCAFLKTFIQRHSYFLKFHCRYMPISP